MARRIQETSEKWEDPGARSETQKPLKRRKRSETLGNARKHSETKITKTQKLSDTKTKITKTRKQKPKLLKVGNQNQNN